MSLQNSVLAALALPPDAVTCRLVLDLDRNAYIELAYFLDQEQVDRLLPALQKAFGPDADPDMLVKEQKLIYAEGWLELELDN